MPGGSSATHQAIDSAGGGAGGDVNIHDGVGNPLTSTVVGADQALDVNIVAGAGAGGTSMVDDAAFTPGVTAITPAGAMFDDAAPDSVDEGDGGVVRMSANRNLYTTIRDAAGNERGVNVDANNTAGVNFGGVSQPVNDGGVSLSVDNGGVPVGVNFAGVAQPITARDGAGNLLTSTLVGADQSLDVNVTQATAPAGSATAANQATEIGHLATIAGDTTAIDGKITACNTGAVVISAALPAGANNIGDVDVLSVPAPLNVVGGGTEAAAQRVTIANDSTGQVTIDGTVTASNTAGDVADDAPDSGNPVKIGGVAVETDGSDPTSVSAEGDRAEVRTDLNRRLLVNTAHPNLWRTNNNYAAAQTNQQQKAAPGANLSLYVQRFIISADAAVNIQLVDDTAGAPATILGPYYIAANAGAVIDLEPPVRIDANTDIGITSSAAVNHTVTITGYTAP